MINIRPITYAWMYTYGSWTSQILYNANAGFYSATSEWGYLAWDEENTGTGYTGYVRIDVLNAADDSILIADIAKNTDGTPTDISTLATTYDIKIRVKIYGADYPTPVAKNIRIKHKNWSVEQCITNMGKNILLNRFLETPTTNTIYDLQVGNGQVTPIIESTTDLINAVSALIPIDGSSSTVTFTGAENLIEVTFTLNNSEIIVPNGTVMNSIGFSNNDAIPLFAAGSTYTNITKDSSYFYTYKIAFKVISKTSNSYIFNSNGKNILINRSFYNPSSYTGLKYGEVGYQTTALSDSVTALDSVLFGPTTFNYTILDTTKYRLSDSIYQATTDGNGNTYNSIGHTNNDGSPILMFIALTDEDIVKTTSYIYQYIVNYNLLTPISALL